MTLKPLPVADTIRLQMEHLRTRALMGEMDHDPLLKAMILAETEPTKQEPTAPKMEHKTPS